MIKVITKFAYKYGDVLASPWTIVLFVFVSFTALPQTIIETIQRGDITILISWFSQNHVQLVALPALAFVQDRQGRAAQRHAEAAQAHAEEMYGWWRDVHTSMHNLHLKTDSLHEKVDQGADS
jgi:hypothetical protein